MENRENIKKEYFDGIDIEFTEERYRKFVANVWRRFLSNDGYYLLMPISPLMTMGDLEEFLKNDSFVFKVTSKEAMKTATPGEIGFIVTIDWEDEKELYMPGEFFKPTRAKVRPNIGAVYSINSGEGIVNSAFVNAKTIAECLDIPFMSFNKYDYDGYYEMDEDTFVREVVTNYILSRGRLFSVELRDKLFNKYYNIIISTYRKQKEANLYNDEEYINQIGRFIDGQENIKGLSL